MVTLSIVQLVEESFRLGLLVVPVDGVHVDQTLHHDLSLYQLDSSHDVAAARPTGQHGGQLIHVDVWKKEGNVLSNDALNTIIWHQTYSKGHFGMQERAPTAATTWATLSN